MDFEKRDYSFSGNFHSNLKHQMSTVVALIIARKVRVNLPDQSGLVLQSLGQLNEKPNPSQPQPVHNSGIRRYSIAPEESEEILRSSEVLPKFGSILTHSALMVSSRGGSDSDTFSKTSSDVSTTTSSTNTTSNIPASGHSLTRVQSSPHLSVLSSLLGGPQKNSSEGSDIISQYIHRGQAHSNLLEVAEYKAEGSDSSINKATIMSSSLTSDVQKPIESNRSSTNSFGFGILSRTRQFGAWLTQATDGGKLVVTKKDLNALAPNTF